MTGDRSALPDLRPMTLGELLDRALQLFRQHWRPLLLVGLIGIIPGIFNNALRLAQPQVTRQLPFANLLVKSRLGDQSTTGLFFVVNSLVGLFVTGTVVMLTTQAILGQTVSLRAGMKTVLRRYLALLGTSILAGLGFLLAFVGLMILALILPYIALPLVAVVLVVLSVIWAFQSQAVLLDGTPGGSQALRRSSDLVKGRFWLTTSFVILLMVGIFVATLGAQFLLGYALRLLPTGPVTTWISAVVSGLPGVVTAPASALATTLFYYDTRMRKEGFDLAYKASLPDQPIS